MSIKAKPWEGGTGGATVPDASETTKGKIQIATSAEATTGTNDLKAMTPLTVKERIDAALVGGVEYKGIFNVTSATPDLSNAEKGDMYIISGTGALYGQQWVTGDHLLINDDMGGSITNSKIDKVDNTDQVTSVNGLTGAVLLSADDMAADHSASNYTPSNTTIEGHLSGVDSALGNKQPLDAQLTDVAGLTPSNNHVIIGDGSNFTASQLASTQLSDSADLARLASPALTGTPTAPTATSGTNTTQLATTAFVTAAVAAGGGNQITDIEIKTGSTFTAEANHLYICGYTSGTQTITFPDASSSTTGDIIGLSTQSSTRAVSLVSSDGTTNDILNNTNDTRGGTNGALSLSIHRQVSWFVSDGALWLEMNAALKPVATTGAYSDLSGAPTVPSALNDLSDVTITGAGTGEVLRYSGSAWVDAQLAYSDLSGTPTLATVATTGAYSDLSGTPTVPTTLNTLTDVSISSVSNGQVISYNSTSGEWENSTPASGGATDLNGLSDVTITSASSGQILRNNGAGQFVNVALSIVDDPSPQLGGNLDVNGQSITSASGGNVVINPDGAGTINLGADTIPDADATHDLGTESARFAEIHGELEGAVMFKARNETGGSLTKGQAVYISGLSGSTPLISLAQSNSASTMQAFGLLAANVSNNADVKVITFGNLTDIDTSSFSAGDTVFISSTVAGGLVSSAPTGTANLIQNIGKVVRSHASAGIIKVGGAGRTNATPNLNNGQVFVGNASNQAVATALSSIAVTSLNGSAGAVTLSADDLAADHSASNYTAANANIDGHLSGIDTKLGTISSGGVDPTLTVRGSTTYTLTAANAKGVHIWYAGTTSATFTVTMPLIEDVISTATASDGDPKETFEVYIGRRVAGDITVSATDTIEVLGDGSSSYASTQTVRSGQWIKIVGWYNTSTNQKYIMSGSSQAYDAGLQSISGLTTAADKMLYTTASDTYAVADLTSAGRALLDDANATAQRTTLGLGTVATLDTGTSDGQVIVADSTGLPAIDGSQLTGVLKNVVEDTTPQLGGNLDTNGQDIVTTSNADLDLAPDGSGVVTIKGNATGGSGQIKLNCEQNSHGVTIKGPPHSASATYTLTLPNNDGDANQVLKTDGSGGLSWVDQSGGGSAPSVTNATASSSPYPSSGVLASTGIEQIFILDPDSSDVVVNMPSGSTAGSGFKYQIKNMNASNNLTLTPASGTIDGSSTYVTTSQYESITCVSDGTNWFII